MRSVASKPPATDVPVDGILVRRPAEAGWLGALPAAPPGSAVTVSLTDPAAAIRHATELTGRGYRPIGAFGSNDGGRAWADFLVPRHLAATQEGWTRQLLGPAGRLYEPTLGPVRMLLGPVLVAHGS